MASLKIPLEQILCLNFLLCSGICNIGDRTSGDRNSGGPYIFFGHLTNHELQISLKVKANLEAFTEIRNWAVLLLNISTLI